MLGGGRGVVLLLLPTVMIIAASRYDKAKGKASLLQTCRRSRAIGKLISCEAQNTLNRKPPDPVALPVATVEWRSYDARKVNRYTLDSTKPLQSQRVPSTNMVKRENVGLLY